jgi:hypothetical protein
VPEVSGSVTVMLAWLETVAYGAAGTPPPIWPRQSSSVVTDSPSGS